MCVCVCVCVCVRVRVREGEEISYQSVCLKINVLLKGLFKYYHIGKELGQETE